MSTIHRDRRVHPSAAAVDGPLLLIASAGVLLTSGLFALFFGMTGRFLPHDERFLGMTAGELCALHGCRVVHFMVHDRVAFGGALVAVGTLYLWMAASPFRRGQVWARWAFLLTGMVGFGSFLAFLGFGYLDAWHGVATLGLLAVFALGLARSRRTLAPPEGVVRLPQPADWGPPPGRLLHHLPGRQQAGGDRLLAGW